MENVFQKLMIYTIPLMEIIDTLIFCETPVTKNMKSIATNYERNYDDKIQS
jgi:ribosomal silencing factor RsfS